MRKVLVLLVAVTFSFGLIGCGGEQKKQETKKTEPAKTEPAKTEPTKTEPTK